MVWFHCAGIRVDKSRLREEMSRQAAATVTTHHVHLFSCMLTKDEMAAAKVHAQVRSIRLNSGIEMISM